MSMISEQVKELRIAAVYKEHSLKMLLEQAADTIESLSAKLAAVNMERPDRYYGGGWIACEDRLPGEREGVEAGSTQEEFLVTVKSFSGGEYCTVSSFEEPIQDFWHDDVVAWQPKPDPFRS